MFPMALASSRLTLILIALLAARPFLHLVQLAEARRAAVPRG